MDTESTRPAPRRTTDHDEIRQWVEARRGKPAQEKGTSGGEDENEPGVLQITFPNTRTIGSIEVITWEQFFEKFDHAHLALEFRRSSDVSNCDCRLVSRHQESRTN